MVNKVQTSLGIVVTDQLLDKLKEVFPVQLPEHWKHVDASEIAFKVGQQNVINYLKRLQRDLIEDGLSSK